MERQPSFDGPELPPQPNLLEIFANQEVTVFGITGTLSDLAAMCPKDLSEDMEATNRFVVHTVNEAGLAIDPEHVPFFTSVLETKGAEVKFKVKQDVPTERPPQSARVAEETVHHPSEPVKAQVSAKHTTSSGRTHTLPAAQRLLAGQSTQPEVGMILSSTGVDKQVVVPQFAPELIREILHRPVTEPAASVLEAGSTPAELIPGAIQATLPTREQPGMTEVPEVASTVAVEGAGTVTNEALSELYGGSESETEPIAVQALAAELYKPPQEVFEDFQVALDEFVALLAAPEQAIYTDVESERNDRTTQLLPLMIDITSGLRQLDAERVAAVGEVLRDALGAVHGLAILESMLDVDCDAADAVRADLAVTCVQLLELLNLEPTTEHVALLAEVLLNPLFAQQFGASAASDARLDHMHEYAQHLVGLHGFTWPWQTVSRHVLGSLAVFQTSSPLFSA